MNPQNITSYARNYRVINGLLCLSVQAIAATMGIDSNSAENTIKKGLESYRKNGGSWLHFADELDERRKWISYEHLPTQTRLRVAFAARNDVWAAYYQECLLDDAVKLIVADDAAYFHELKQYSITQVEQLAEACGWLRMCSPKGWWKDKFAGKIQGMEAATQVLAARNLYGLRVSNWQSLDLKCKKWLQNERESLVSKLFGNNNKSKVREIGDTPLHRIIDLYAHGTKLRYTEVQEVYNREAKTKGWPLYSAERVRQILESNKDAWMYTRHGVNAARAVNERHLKRKRPEYADQLWTIDGTTLQLGMDKNGQFRKEWTMVIIADSYSDCVIGWACGSTETLELVLRALRMAIRKRGYGPAFTQFDNGGANKSRQVSELFDRMNVVGIPAQPYNGKSKYIERILGRIEQGMLRHMPNFYGGNITTRSLNSKANPDYTRKQLKSGTLPTDASALLDQLNLAIEVYNNTEVKARKATPIQLYDTPDERRKPIPYLQLVSLFWIKRPEAVRYNPGGIMIQVDKQRYEYEVQSKPGVVDAHFLAEYSGNSFIVRYDPDDLSAINLYDKEDHYIATATSKYEFAAVPTKGEGELLREALAQRKQKVAEGLQNAQIIRAEMEDAGLEEASFELVHKDALNRIEASVAEKYLSTAAVDTDDYVPKTRANITAPELRSPYYNRDFAQRLLDAPDLDD